MNTINRLAHFSIFLTHVVPICSLAAAEIAVAVAAAIVAVVAATELAAVVQL